MPIRRKRAKARRVFNRDNVTELGLFLNNDGRFYERWVKPIGANMARKKAKGTYHPRKAEIAWKHAADAGAKLYAKEVAGNEASWNTMFSPGDRAELARQAARAWEVEHKIRNRG